MRCQTAAPRDIDKSTFETIVVDGGGESAPLSQLHQLEDASNCLASTVCQTRHSPPPAPPSRGRVINVGQLQHAKHVLSPPLPPTAYAVWRLSKIGWREAAKPRKRTPHALRVFSLAVRPNRSRRFISTPDVYVCAAFHEG